MKVSIGLPCYNCARTVADTLRSIFAQSYDDWELIVVDDGSTDGTVDLVRQVQDPRIQVHADGENRRLAARLNQITQLARGEMLFRMDADDLMFPDRVERQLAFLEGYPDVDLLGGAIVCIDEDNRPRSQRCPPVDVVGANEVLSGGVLYHPTVAAWTHWFREHPYDEAYHRTEDFELWCRTAPDTVIRNIGEPLLFYREYGGFSWRKYCLDSALTKQVLRRHGPSKVGRLATARLLAGRYAKDSVYGGLKLIGRLDAALALRNQPLGEEAVERLGEVLRHIRETRLPGID